MFKKIWYNKFVKIELSVIQREGDLKDELFYRRSSRKSLRIFG